MQDFVKLASWEDRGYYAMRASTEKAQRQLHRLTRNANEVPWLTSDATCVSRSSASAQVRRQLPDAGLPRVQGCAAVAAMHQSATWNDRETHVFRVTRCCGPLQPPRSSQQPAAAALMTSKQQAPQCRQRPIARSKAGLPESMAQRQASRLQTASWRGPSLPQTLQKTGARQ